MLISLPGGTRSLQQFRTLGIERRAAKILIAKGMHSLHPQPWLRRSLRTVWSISAVCRYGR